MPQKEFSPEFSPDPYVYRPVRNSAIVINKYKYFDFFKNRHQGFNTIIGMMCGDHLYSNGFHNAFWDGGRLSAVQDAFVSDNEFDFKTLDEEEGEWYLPNCKTPILTSLRLVSDPAPDTRWNDGTTIKEGTRRDPESAFESDADPAADPDADPDAPVTTNPNFIDASDHVMTFSHSWSSSGLTSIEHSGNIQFYLNEEMDVDNNVTFELNGLIDKTFYIEIWAGYRNRDDMPACGSFCELDPADPEKELDCEHSNYTRIPGFFKVFTGMCLGGSISREYGKKVMNCMLEDYLVVLKGMKFFNSPWFDGMKDVVAIKEIISMAGFRDQGEYDPGKLIKGLSDDAVSATPNKFHDHFDGRKFKMETYALPSGYNRLLQPSFKFNDGDSFIDAINKISVISAKLFYFDEFGMAHYEDYQDAVEQDFEGALPLVPLYFFTTNPETNGGQLVFDKVDMSFDMSHVVSHLKTLTNTPDMHLLIRDVIKWEHIENPNTSGFLGYQKTFYQQQSMFGSKEAQIEAMKKYTVFFKAIGKIKFETYGLPMRATDIINFEGAIYRVVRVNHTMDAAKNQWWMQVECERFQSIEPV